MQHGATLTLPPLQVVREPALQLPRARLAIRLLPCLDLGGRSAFHDCTRARPHTTVPEQRRPVAAVGRVRKSFLLPLVNPHFRNLGRVVLNKWQLHLNSDGADAAAKYTKRK